jgi:hypothetical protein
VAGLSEASARFYTACILMGLQWLHSRRILHRCVGGWVGKCHNSVCVDKGLDDPVARRPVQERQRLCSSMVGTQLLGCAGSYLALGSASFDQNKQHKRHQVTQLHLSRSCPASCGTTRMQHLCDVYTHTQVSLSTHHIPRATGCSPCAFYATIDQPHPVSAAAAAPAALQGHQALQPAAVQ